jgi:transposase
MPNFNREDQPTQDDLDIASRVMATVQKQVASYQQSLETLREMRKELTDEPGGRAVTTPQELADLLEERGIPQALSKAMAAEDFQDETFASEASLWTWDCCCTDCCITCQMATQVTGCPDTFIFLTE